MKLYEYIIIFIYVVDSAAFVLIVIRAKSFLDTSWNNGSNISKSSYINWYYFVLFSVAAFVVLSLCK